MKLLLALLVAITASLHNVKANESGINQIDVSFFFDFNTGKAISSFFLIKNIHPIMTLYYLYTVMPQISAPGTY